MSPTKLLRPVDLNQPDGPVSRTNGHARIAFTRASSLAPAIGFLRALGAPVSRFVRQARIPSALLEGESLIPLHLVHRFAEIAARVEGIPDLGLAIAQRTSAYDLGVYGHLLLRAVTVYDYLHTGIQGIGLVTSGARFWLTPEKEQFRFHVYSPGTPSVGRSQADVYTLLVTIKMLRAFAGGDWRPREVRLLAPSSEFIGDGRVFGDAETHFKQSHSSFTIPVTLLQQAIPLAMRYRDAVPGSMVASVPAMPEDFLESIELLIASLLPTDCLEIDLVAEAAGISTRTLQRRLETYGLSYSGIVNQIRIRVGSDWLVNTGMSVAEIAAALGYRDPSNFARAFRRKAGIPPQQYRDQHR